MAQLSVYARFFSLLAFSMLWLLTASSAHAQGSAFSYQGKLTDAGNPANGTYDLQLTVWDASSGGTQQPQPSPVTVTRTSVLVTSGIFTVQLDFGANAFPGADRFLEIGARPAGGGAFTILSPRQPITATPYAVRSLNASTSDTATNAAQLGGAAASQYVQTTDSRLSDSRPPTAGSTNYIQNTVGPQAGANFNISGNGTVGGRLSSASLGVGTPNPQTTLDVRGYLTVDPGADPLLFTSSSGLEKNRYLRLVNSPDFESASGLKAGGVLISDTYSYANPGKNDLV